MIKKIEYHSPHALYQMHEELRDKEGPITVFLHGGPGFNNVAEQAIFSSAKMKSFNMLWFDQLGCRNSPANTPAEINLENTLNDMGEIFNLFGNRGVNLVGFCIGTQIAHHFTARFPELVKRIILISPTINTARIFQRLIKVNIQDGTIHIDKTTQKDIDILLNTPTDQYGMAQLIALANIVLQVPQWNNVYWHNKDAMAKYFQLAGEHGIAADVFFTIQNELLSKKLPNLENIYAHKEVLLLQGEQDRIVEWEVHGKVIQQAVPHAISKFIQNAGHWAHLENSEQFLNILEDFCRAS